MGVKKQKFIVSCLAVLIGLGVLGLAGSMDVEDAAQQVSQYCENVKDWKASNGQRGWPDYNGNYNEICD